MFFAPIALLNQILLFTNLLFLLLTDGIHPALAIQNRAAELLQTI